MTKFDTFGHISPCRWGRRGKKLIKPEYILGQGPTQKKIDQFADPCAGKLIFLSLFYHPWLPASEKAFSDPGGNCANQDSGEK